MPQLPMWSRRPPEERIISVRFWVAAHLTLFDASLPEKMAFYVYILKCNNNTFYTGITYDLRKRLTEHQEGLCISTKGKLPVHLVYYETAVSRKEARFREITIKDMSQRKKLLLIEKFTSSTSEKRE